MKNEIMKQKKLIEIQEKIIKCQKNIMFFQRRLQKLEECYNSEKKNFENSEVSEILIEKGEDD